MIDPHEIEMKQFTTRRLREGYDPDEVDAFLDEVLVGYREALLQLGIAQQGLEHHLSVCSPAPAIPPVIGDVSRMLQVAQRTADEQIAEANGEAGQIVVTARQQADEIVAQGHEKRHTIIGQLEERRSKLEELVEYGLTTKAQMVAALKGALDELEAAP